MMINIKLIVPKNTKSIDSFMAHRMLCFGFDSAKGNDSLKFKTFVYYDGCLTDIVEQRQNNTSLSATPSVDVMKYYLSNEYDLYDEEVWEDMNDGDYKIMDVAVDWEIVE